LKRMAFNTNTSRKRGGPRECGIEGTGSSSRSIELSIKLLIDRTNPNLVSDMVSEAEECLTGSGKDGGLTEIEV
jgi:hypothetical protein